MKNRKHIRVIKTCLFLLIFSICTAILLIGWTNVRRYIFMPSTLKYDEICDAQLFNYDSYNNNKLVATDHEAWISLTLPCVVNIRKISFEIENLKSKDPDGRVYYDVSQISGNKYIDFYLSSGKNIISFSRNAQADKIQLHLTKIKNNSFSIKNIEIYTDNVIQRRFIALTITIWLIILLIYYNRYKIKIFFTNKQYLYILFGTTLLFLSLYGKYIWSGELYGYTDVGSDTYYGYLPAYFSMLDKFYNVDFSLFNIYDGIGNSIMASANVHMELPFMLILSAFGKSNIYQGILFCTYLKICLLEIFTFNYFKLLNIDNRVALICSFIWGFSGFNVLWGQHQFFLTATLVFSLLMYIVENCMKNNKRWWLFFALIVGLYSINNFYFLYSCLATVGVYYLLRQLFCRVHIRQLIKNCLWYVFYSFLGIGVFWFFSAEWIICLLESARTIEGGFQFVDISLEKVCNIIGRLISTDSFGISQFTGLNNLYEGSILSTSILAIVSIYWINKTKKNFMFLTVAMILSLFLPVTGTLFLLLNSYRWTYFYAFLIIVSIAFMLNDFLKENVTLKLKDIVSIIFIYIGLLSILYIGSYCLNIKYNYSSIFFKSVVLLIYLGIIFIKKQQLLNSILLLLFVELLGGNFNLVNMRQNVTQQDFNELVTGETEKLLDEIKGNDSEQLFRIVPYNYQGYLSHGNIGAYAGLNSYSSLNKKYAINFIDSLAEMDGSYALSHDANHFSIACGNYALQTLLGVKYIITDSVPPIGYVPYAKTEHLTAYLNSNHIPMGMLYYNQINIEDYRLLSLHEKNLCLFKAYYLDDNEESFTEEKLDEKLKINFSDTFMNEGNSISGTATNQNESITIMKPTHNYASELLIEMTSPGTGLYMKIYYAQSREEFSEEKVIYRYLINGTRKYSIYIDEANIEKIKIIPILVNDDSTYYFKIDNISIVDWNEKYESQYILNAQAIAEQNVYNPSFINDTYTAFCNSPEAGMFFIPLSYSVNWSATVNGQETAVYKINDGFCGIKVPKGEAYIEMKYATAGKSFSLIISLLCILLYNVLAYKRFKNL